MEILPIELFHHIFGYLNLIDLANCKLVNKLFYENVNEFKIKELSCFPFTKTWLSVRSYWSHNYSIWFYINKPIKRNNLLLANYKCSILKTPSLNLNFLKYLSVLYCSNNEFNLSDLMNFDRLEVLMIDLANYENEKYTKLKLKKLISLRICPSDYVAIEIEAPMLEALYCLDLKNLKIIYPRTLKYLKTIEYSTELSLYNNLECLTLVYSNGLNTFNSENFPKLTKLQVILDDGADEMINLITNKKADENLKIYSNGIFVSNGSELIDSENFDLSVNLKNYDKSFPVLEWINQIGYNELMNSNNQQIPADFFKKYCNIVGIKIYGKVINQNNLIQFIRNCKVLRELSIVDSELDQQFYDQLPTISLLDNLEISREHSESFIDVKFDFILKMNHLMFFTTTEEIPTETICKLDQLKNIKEIYFWIQDTNVIIHKIKDGSFRVKVREFDLFYNCKPNLNHFFNQFIKNEDDSLEHI